MNTKQNETKITRIICSCTAHRHTQQYTYLFRSYSCTQCYICIQSQLMCHIFIRHFFFFACNLLAVISKSLSTKTQRQKQKWLKWQAERKRTEYNNNNNNEISTATDILKGSQKTATENKICYEAKWWKRERERECEKEGGREQKYMKKSTTHHHIVHSLSS